jgi:hypothetical protein
MNFTVVLLVPDYLCEDAPYGQDVVITQVSADNPAEAFTKAQQQAGEMFEDDGDKFALCVTFDGWHWPVTFGKYL